MTRTLEAGTSLWRVPDTAGPDETGFDETGLDVTGPDVTGLDWDVGHDPLTSYEPDVAEPPVGHDAAPATVPAVSFRHRHRVALAICAALLVVLGGGVGVFAYLWNHSGPHQLSVATAVERFGSGASGRITDPGTLRPAAGVYSYTGKAVEHVSLPPKTQTEGPGFPGTISYLPRRLAGRSASTTATRTGRARPTAPAGGTSSRSAAPDGTGGTSWPW